MAKRGRKKSTPGFSAPAGGSHRAASSDSSRSMESHTLGPPMSAPVVPWSVRYLDEQPEDLPDGHASATGPSRKRRKILSGAAEESPEPPDPALGYKLDTNPQSLKRERFRTGGLNRWYKVVPARPYNAASGNSEAALVSWSKIEEYKSFEWQGTKHAQGSFIDVSGTDSMRYLGRIVEIRATDTQHVNLLVSWLYLPEELPKVKQSWDGKWVKGRQSYHGSREVIASNHMDIIPAYSVNGPINVVRWDETDPTFVAGGRGSYFWRQGYDLKTQELSEVNLLCSCKRPENPDRELVQCSNAACASWLHKECLEQTAKEAALSQPADEEARPVSASARKRRKPSSTPRSTRNGDVCLESQLQVDTALVIPEQGAPSLRLTLRSEPTGGGKGIFKEWETPVLCLVCGEKVE